MDIPRELFYEDKKTLDSFEIGKDGSFNRILFEDWLLTLTDLKPGINGYMSRILQVFNDSYFICTLILCYPRNCLKTIPYYISKTTIPSVVIPMVHFYLQKIETKDTRIIQLLTALKTEMERMGWESNLNRLENNGKFKKKKIMSKIFLCRKLEPSFLPTIDWAALTTSYKKENVVRIIGIVAKNEEEAKLMAKAISDDAHKTEDDFYNPKPCIEIDDDEFPDIPEPDNNLDYIPDYSEAYNLCSEIINGEGYATIIQKPQNVKFELENEFAIKRILNDLLGGDWFDDFSTDAEAYTPEWRRQLIDELLKTEWGPQIASDWKTKNKKVKCALVGALMDCGVLKRKKTEIAHKLYQIEDIKEETITKYMGDGIMKPYSDWLGEYINSSPFVQKTD